MQSYMRSHFSAAHHSTNVALSVARTVVYVIISLILCSNLYACFLQVTIVTFLTYG